MIKAAKQWVNRIVGHGEVVVDDVLANENNWRIHPRAQQDALEGILGDVGIVQNVIINKRTGEEWPDGQRNVETMLDGHLRVMLAIRKGQKRLPVTYVDLTPAEEAEVLATLDPIGAMAMADREAYRQVLEGVQTEDAAILDVLASVAEGPQRQAEDRELEEIDLDALPLRPVWALCAIPTELLPEAQPLLQQLEGLGVRVEVSDG